MSFVISTSEPESLPVFLTPSKAAIAAAVGSHHRYTIMERRTSSKGKGPHRRGATHGNEQRQQRRPWTGRDHGSPPPGYLSVELVLVFLCVAASLAFLPLVLPPLSPPPFLLLLVPVGLLAVLVALAFVPLDAQNHLVGSSRL